MSKSRIHLNFGKLITEVETEIPPLKATSAVETLNYGRQWEFPLEVGLMTS